MGNKCEHICRLKPGPNSKVAKLVSCNGDHCLFLNGKTISIPDEQSPEEDKKGFMDRLVSKHVCSAMAADPRYPCPDSRRQRDVDKLAIKLTF
jgi:hypothetical protein